MNGQSERGTLASQLGFFAYRLGRLTEDAAINAWERSLGHISGWGERGTYLRSAYQLMNAGLLELAAGRLVQFRSFIQEATSEGKEGGLSGVDMAPLWSLDELSNHLLGEPTSIKRPPTHANARSPLDCRWLLDLGDFATCRNTCLDALQAERETSEAELLEYHAILARLDIEEARDPTPHIATIRARTSRSGDMEYIVKGHLLTAQHLLSSGDSQAALGDAETGLLHAVGCGYGLLRIELLVALARIRLAWPDPPKAIQSAREALDLATAPDCQYAWGEADAAQVWGEAYVANHEPALAHRAFTQALAVRKRVEHPGVDETQKWLAMTGV